MGNILGLFLIERRMFSSRKSTEVGYKLSYQERLSSSRRVLYRGFYFSMPHTHLYILYTCCNTVKDFFIAVAHLWQYTRYSPRWFNTKRILKTSSKQSLQQGAGSFSSIPCQWTCIPAFSRWARRSLLCTRELSNKDLLFSRE